MLTVILQNLMVNYKFSSDAEHFTKNNCFCEKQKTFLMCTNFFGRNSLDEDEDKDHQVNLDIYAVRTNALGSQQMKTT